MGYCELTDVKEWMAPASANTDDDDLITRLIAVATEMIETYCRRKFEQASETRYYQSDRLVQPASLSRDFQALYITPLYLSVYQSNQILHLDKDLLSIDPSGLINANGETLPDDSYYLLPYNTTAKQWIYLKDGYIWQWNVDGRIAVTGKWGRSTTAPETVKQACIELTTYLYRSRSSSSIDAYGNPETGEMGVPVSKIAIPGNIRYKLDPLKRRKIL